MTPNDFVSQWNQPLQHLDPILVLSLPIPHEAQLFLLQAGLPKQATPHLTFYSPPDLLAPLPTVLAAIDFEGDLARYRVLADGVTFLCVDTQLQGAIASVDPYEKLPTRFVNSSIPQFAACLLAYRRIPSATAASTMTKTALHYATEIVFAQIKQIDAPALQPDCWWSVIFEELFIFTR